jgi:hypothetical protein
MIECRGSKCLSEPKSLQTRTILRRSISQRIFLIIWLSSVWEYSINNCHSRNVSCALRFYHVISCNITILNLPHVPSKTESLDYNFSGSHSHSDSECLESTSGKTWSIFVIEVRQIFSYFYNVDALYNVISYSMQPTLPHSILYGFVTISALKGILNHDILSFVSKTIDLSNYNNFIWFSVRFSNTLNHLI